MTRARMRILYHESAPGVGGSTVCLSKLVAGLDRSRYEPYVVLAYRNETVERSLFPGIPLSTVPKRFYNGIIGNALINRLLRRLSARLEIVYRLLLVTVDCLSSVARLCSVIRTNRIELVHANNGLGSNLASILAASLCRVPCICHVRNIEEFNLLQRLTRNRVDRFIAVSEVVRRTLLRHGIAEGAVATVYDGLTDAELAHRYHPERLRQEFGIPPEALVCGMVGMVTRWKGCDVFLTAVSIVIREYPDLVAVVVGDTITAEDTGYKSELQQFVTDRGLENRVIFTGFRADTFDLFSSFDLAVHASVAPEPFGMVLLEAMAAGRPVVASRAGGPLEIITHEGDGLLYDPGNAEELARCILRLLRDRPLRMKLGAQARKTIVDHYPMRQTVASIEELYDAFAEQRQGTRIHGSER